LIQNVTVNIFHGFNRKIEKGYQQRRLNKGDNVGKRFANYLYDGTRFHEIKTNIGVKMRKILLLILLILFSFVFL
jgi:hypothetical protein